MNRYINGFWAAFLLFIFILTPEILSARHIIGGEVTYRYLGVAADGANRYGITMKVYRDCLGGGADFDDPAQFAIYQGKYDQSTRIKAFQVHDPDIKKLVPVPPPCVSSLPNVCVEEAIYYFEIALPLLTDQSYFIVYQRCCRNQTISNVISPGDHGATFMVEITPEAQQLKNSSPTFTNFPPIIICNNIPLYFDHSATDVDGDQIFYSLCSPLDGGGPLLNPPGVTSCDGAVPTPPCGPPFDNIPFAVPVYGPSNPMGGNPQITINPQTGIISGTPIKQGQFVVGVCIEEFRGAVLLSRVRRDFQFNVAECSPSVLANIKSDSIAGPQQFVLKSCGENAVTFQNLSLQPANIFSFEWQFNIKGQLYSNKKDWNPTITFPDTGFYKGALYLNAGSPCADTALISLNVFPEINADFAYDYDTCIAGPVAFTDKSTGEAGVNRWYWNFGVPSGTARKQNPSYLYPIPGDHPVQLRVYDKNNCSDNITKVINWFPVPPLIIIQPSRFIGCAPAEITFTNLSTPIDSTYDIRWDFGDGKTQRGVISPTHVYDKTGIYDVKVEITSPIGCFTADSFPNLIRVEPSPVADFTFSPDSLLSNFNNTVQFTDLSTGANRWNWRFDRYGTTTQRNPAFTFPDTGLMKVTLIVTHPEGCKDSLSKYLDFQPLIYWYMPNAFTPNGDGQNDGFFGKGYLEGVADFHLTIWNRWGELVFETNNPDEEWNGRQKNVGGMSPEGVYVYILTFTGPRGEKKEYKGYATLIR